MTLGLAPRLFPTNVNSLVPPLSSFFETGPRVALTTLCLQLSREQISLLTLCLGCKNSWARFACCQGSWKRKQAAAHLPVRIASLAAGGAEGGGVGAECLRSPRITPWLKYIGARLNSFSIWISCLVLFS